MEATKQTKMTKEDLHLSWKDVLSKAGISARTCDVAAPASMLTTCAFGARLNVVSN